MGINATGALPNTSAGLDISFTNKGVLIPRLTAVQRLAIPNPANGLLVFDTDSDCFFFYKTSFAQWTSLCSLIGAQGPPGPTGVANIQTYGVYGTTTAGVSATTFVSIPGLSLTINLVNAATLNIFTYGGLSGGVNGSTGKIQLFMNGNPVSQAIQTVSMVGSFIPTVGRENWSIATFLNLPAGIYTFDIRASLNSGGYSAYSAGAFSDSQSALIIQVFY